MLKISAIFLISFIVFSSCLEISPVDQQLLQHRASKDQLINILVEVKTESDGSTIRGFIRQLKKMLMNLVRAQNKHRRIHKNMFKRCTREDRFRKKEIRAATIALKKALRARTRCHASLKAARRALPALTRTLRTYRREFIRKAQLRRIERQKYFGRKRALTQAIKFLARFIRYVRRHLRKGYKAWALAEMSQTLLKHSANLNMMTDAVPVLVAIASERKGHNYTYRANQGLGRKLRKALNLLVRRLRKDNARNNREERKARFAWRRYSARLRKAISALKRNIKKIRRQIIFMAKCKRTETRVIRKAAAKRARNSTLRKNARKMCRSFNKEFLVATYHRLDEIKTMAIIIKIVRRRFKNLPKGLVAYLRRVKEGWIKYVNSTKFKKYKAYKRRHFKVNKRGRRLARRKARKGGVHAYIRGAHGVPK